MAQEQTLSLFEGGSKPHVVRPDTGFSGNTGLIESIQATLPKYRGINPYTLTKQLIENDSFFEEFTNDYITATNSVEMQRLEREDPEAYHSLNANFRKNFRNDLISTSYAGETEKDTLVRRTRELRTNPTKIPVDTYKDIVRRNPDAFKEFGLIDQDNNLIYGDSRDDEIAFATKVTNNPELHEAIVLHRYTQFQETLGRAHNNPALIEDPALRTQAWVVFDNFESEGLTRYMNVLQRSREPIDIHKEYVQREDPGYSFFMNATVRGKRADELIRDYVVGSSVEGTKYDDLINTSAEYGVSPDLMAGMIAQESGYDPNAISPVGAVGLVQYMPAFARESGLKVPDELYDLDVRRMEASGDEREAIERELVKRTREISTIENDERLDPEKSIRSASIQLAKRLERYGFDPEKAVASWNAGAGRVDRAIRDAEATGRDWKEFIPQKETVPHISKVMEHAEKLGVASSLMFQPVEPRDDITKEVPKDLNPFTEHYYQLSSSGDSLEDIDSTEPSLEFLRAHAPKDYHKFIDEDNLRTNGEFSDEYGLMTWSVFEWAHDTGNLPALMDTVMANGQFHELGTEPAYRIVYDEVDAKTRIAIDALRYDDEGRYMFQYVSDGVWDFRPLRRETAQANWDSVKNVLFSTDTEMYMDENGEMQRRYVPSKGGFSGTWNSLMTVGIGVADWANRFFLEPVTRIGGEITGHEGTQRLASHLQDWTGVNMSSAFTAENDGVVPNAIGEVAPFIQWMGAMMAGGSGVLRGSAYAMRGLTNAKRAYDVGRYAGTMSGVSRWQHMANRLVEATTKKAPWATGSLTKTRPWVSGAGVFYTGGALVEATQPASESMINTIPQMLGYEPTNSARELYMTSSRWTQVGMDVLGSLVMDGLLDTAIAGSKFYTGKAAQKYFGRKEFKGLRYKGPEYDNQKFGGYEVVDEPVFRHDVREFWHNLTSGLDEIPIGEVGTSMAKTMAHGQPFETLHDFTRHFVDNTDFAVSRVKKDIEEQIRYLNRILAKSTDAKLTDEDIARLVDEQYAYFLDTLSDQVYGVLREGSDELPLKFAQTLDEQIPTIKEFKPSGTPIRAHQMGDYPDARLIEKGGRVYEVDPQFWTIDLAESIRLRALRDTKETVLNRKKDALPQDYTAEQLQALERQVDEVIGTPVRVGDQTGYVVDFDSSGYTVRTVDGDLHRTKVLTELTEEELQNLRTSAINNRMVRARLAMDMEPPGQQLALPPGRPQETIPFQSEFQATFRPTELDFEPQLQGRPVGLLPSPRSHKIGRRSS